MTFHYSKEKSVFAAEPVRRARAKEQLRNEGGAGGLAGSLSGGQPVGVAGETKALLSLPRPEQSEASNRWISLEEEHLHQWTFVGNLGALSENYVASIEPLPTYWDFDRCVNPIVIVCRECSFHILKACGSNDESVCPPCEMVYRKRIKIVVIEPLIIARPGSTTMLTLTAPGSQLHCLTHTYGSRDRNDKPVRRPSVRCDFHEDSPEHLWDEHQICPCSTEEKILDSKEKIEDWNMTAMARWNDFVTDLRRSVPGFEDFEYFKAVEPQKRGAIHIHAITMSRRLVVIDTAIRTLIRKYAIAHGFGHEIDIEVIANGKDDRDSTLKAARYVAKYVTKTNRESKKAVALPLIPSTVEVTKFVVDPDGEARISRFPVPLQQMRRRRKTYRAWTASRRWGLNLGKVKRLQAAYHDKELLEELTSEWKGIIYEFQSSPPPK